MELSDKSARQLFEHVQANPTRKRFGFGKVPALINIDLQKAYTCVGEFATAYETGAGMAPGMQGGATTPGSGLLLKNQI